MTEMMMEILKVVVMLAVVVVTRYLVPWIRARIGVEKLEEVKAWVSAAVLMAQQVYGAKTGAERKEIVVDLLRDMLVRKNIDISGEQLDMLIEAAVKAMKMKEAQG